MARTYLGDNQSTNQNFGGPIHDDVIGTNGVQTVNLASNANVTFDASFNQGGDIINIAGAAALYQASVIDGNLVISSDNGADIVIPLGDQGITVNFGDDQSFVAIIDGSDVLLGDIVVPTDGTEVDVDAGGVTPPPPPSGDEILLEATRDNLTGTAGNDLFIADIIQNQNGEQTNSLGTGDRIKGAGGNADTLEAQVQDASALNASPSSAIRPIMDSVEVVHFNATQWDGDTIGSDEEFCNLALGVKINAQQTFGTYEWGSVGSDTSLTIYNVNTLPAGSSVGNDDDAQITDVLTVRMDHTGPATPTDDAANLTVLLDNDYLLNNPPELGTSSLTVQLLDIDNQIGGTAESPGGGQPLLTNPFNILRITVDGVSHDVVFDGDNALSGKAAYDALVVSINAGLQAAGLTTLTASVDGTFTVTDPDATPVGGPATGYQVIITDSAGSDLGALGFRAADIVPPNTDYQKEVFNTPPELTEQLITIEIVLNKVGREGDGGYLTAGGMAVLGDEHYYDSLLYNTWHGGAIEHPGIEQFNVHVEGSSNQPSSLAALQSTHNALEVVNVDSVDGSTADLTIGNSQTMAVGSLNGALYGKHAMIGAPTGGDAPSLELTPIDECCVNDDFLCDLTTEKNAGLKDVRVFNSTEFVADASVHGYFSSEVVGKYLDLMDTQIDPRQDNLSPTMTSALATTF